MTLQPGFSAKPGTLGQFKARINRFCDGDFPDGVPVNSLASGNNGWAQHQWSSTLSEEELPPTLFPNPVSSALNLRWPNQAFLARLYAPTGQLVWESQAKARSETEIDVSALPPGTYFCHLQSESDLKILKFNKL